MTRIIHLSDPHFGTERPQVVDALQRLVRELSPDCLVLSGDITQRARPVQFRAARAFLDRLAVPHLLTIPGNHDISLFNPFKRLFAPYRDYRRWIGAELEPVIDLPDVLIIGVNTTRRYRHIQGEVSDRQVQSVARRLRAAGPAQTRIVVTHQPAWVIRPQDQHDRLRGHEDALKEWAKSGADLVLGGHIHLPYIA
ncbi:MAG: metallophosphoesterase, partial [Lacisediminimonas sp.]|nr:metallophosphoesterase [Lacisediminimonas sp.]